MLLNNNFGYVRNLCGTVYVFGMANPRPSYAGASIDTSKLSQDQKLDFVIQQLARMDLKFDYLNGRVDKVSDVVETLQEKMVEADERAQRFDYKCIDLEARSRRQNLIFSNIFEGEAENGRECESKLRQFISYNMNMGDYYAYNDIAFQRVHRLGRPRPDGTARPIIAAFRDDPVKMDVLRCARNLKGSRFSVSQDWPTEIRSARDRL